MGLVRVTYNLLGISQRAIIVSAKLQNEYLSMYVCMYVLSLLKVLINACPCQFTMLNNPKLSVSSALTTVYFTILITVNATAILLLQIFNQRF